VNCDIVASKIGVLWMCLKTQNGDFVENGVTVLIKYESFIETA
jgi:hypothetical protein